ncbi:TlyA family RNA methyltransferase [Brachybacterium halotolerans]|uniref:TlyA family RNA methyltransferase n=1 Tax=Brachybacterium halotolerans TaxID=2795215 RepID=UPI002B1D957D|nr:TlyA family RNA methyltransferase [Brachybacterium halotolerans]
MTADGGDRRLDVALAAAGLASSRTHARRIVEEGRARVDGRPARKPSLIVAADAVLEVTGTPEGGEYASRAAHKLLGALDATGLDPCGLVCLDAGASTGGFTDVLLRRGAREVRAVDIGHGQLHPRLREDPRVAVHEGTSIRGLDPTDVGGPAQLVVGDLSFISLVTLMADLAALTAPGGDLLLMVKPQFEVGRRRLPRSGVVADPALRRDAVLGVVEEADARGLELRGAAESSLPGQDGNHEYFLHLHRRDAAPRGADAPPDDPRPAGAARRIPRAAYDMIEQVLPRTRAGSRAGRRRAQAAAHVTEHDLGPHRADGHRTEPRTREGDRRA